MKFYLIYKKKDKSKFFLQFQSRKISKEKKQAISDYDTRHLQSQDSDEKLDNSNKSLIEKVETLQDRKLLGLFRRNK